MAFDVSDSGNVGDYDGINFGGKEYISCTVCHSTIASDPGVKRELPNYFFPGSEGSIVLNGHLRTYFVLRKLLKLPEEQIFQVIGKEKGEDGGGIGSSSPFVGEICERCEVIVEDAVGLHSKILELQRQVDFLGERLMEFRKSNEGTLSILPDMHHGTDAEMVESTSWSGAVKRKRSRRKSVAFNDDDEDYVPEVKKKTRESFQARKAVTTRTKNEVESYTEENEDSDYVPDDFEEAETSEDDNFLLDNDDSLDFERNEEQPDEYSRDQDQNEAHEQENLQIKSRTPVTDGIISSRPLFEFQCTVCSKIFSARSQLHFHTKRVHGFEMLYPCPLCPDLKFSRTGLREHRIQVHEANYKCYKCGKELSCQRALDRHLRVVHKMKITYPCPLCNQVFQMKSELTQHRKQHIISKEILNKLPERAPENDEERLWAENPCQYCGKTFLSGKTFLNHLKEHKIKLNKQARKTRIKLKCFFCWKTFALEQARWIHTRMDHPEIPLEFPCEICTEEKTVFQNTSELFNHYETVHQKGDVPIHKCLRCGWSFMKEESYKTHIEVHILRLPIINPDEPAPNKAHYIFKCWFCWEMFPTENALQKHVRTARRHKNQKMEFCCDVEQCENHTQPFENVGDLNTHLEKCHGDKSLIYHCSVCSWGFASKDLHDIHKLNHIHRRYTHYKCPTCEKSFKKLWSLKDHFNIEHGSNLEMYKCDYCPLRFTNTRSISKHMSAIHKDKILEGPAALTATPCDQCRKVFRSEKQVKMHQRMMHRPTICADCGCEFPTKHKLDVHRKKYHKKPDEPDEKHLCPDCGKICIGKTALKKHMVIHGEKKFECDECEFKTWTFAGLRAHQNIHVARAKKEPPPPPKFPCELCDKGYSRKDSLDDHVRVEHTSETRRVWVCPKCGKRFTRQGYLDSHVRGKNCSKRFGPDIY